MADNYNKIYISKEKFNFICRNKQTYEGFVIGVGYAFANYCYWQNGNRDCLNPYWANYHSNHFFFIKIQMLDISPKALNLSFGNRKGCWMKNKSTGKYKFSETEEIPNGYEKKGQFFTEKDAKGNERSFNVNGSVTPVMNTSYIEYSSGILDASWVTLAKKELGVEEIRGTKHNPRIIEYHHATSGKFNDDETPWCSSFVNWVMRESNMKRTNSAVALSWKKWGQDLGQTPAFGSIAIINYGKGKGHVGFVVGRNKGGKLIILGGNQGNQVRLNAYNEKSFDKFIYPEGHIPSYELSLIEEDDTLDFNSTR